MSEQRWVLCRGCRRTLVPRPETRCRECRRALRVALFWMRIEWERRLETQ